MQSKNYRALQPRHSLLRFFYDSTTASSELAYRQRQRLLMSAGTEELSSNSDHESGGSAAHRLKTTAPTVPRSRNSPAARSVVSLAPSQSQTTQGATMTSNFLAGTDLQEPQPSPAPSPKEIKTPAPPASQRNLRRAYRRETRQT